MMAETAPRLWTVDEFLAWDDGTDRRYQLLSGAITMMAPPPAIHGRLVSRLDRLLGSQLRPPCEPVTGAGVKPAHRNDAYYLADLAVTCRPFERGETHLHEPVIVIEVLTSATAATDRLEKLDDYRLVPSITDILLVADTQVAIEHWHRWGDVWVVATRRAGERVDVAALGISIDVAALYADLALGPPTAPARD
jgi:Uma2 family endonuclease